MKNKIIFLISIACATALTTGCANRAKIATIDKPNVVATWQPGEGPYLKDLYKNEPESVKSIYLREIKRNEGAARTKFETNEEYEARISIPKTALIKIPIKINDTECVSNYDHETKLYKIENCLFAENTVAIDTEIVEESPFKLANAFDSRLIKHTIINEYRAGVNLRWKSEFKISKELAQKLENSMVAAVFVSVTDTAKACSSCDVRKTSETMAELSKSISVLTDKRRGDSYATDWKQDAFKKGQIVDKWVHAFGVKDIYDIVIYSNIDNKVIYRRTYTTNTEAK